MTYKTGIFTYDHVQVSQNEVSKSVPLSQICSHRQFLPGDMAQERVSLEGLLAPKYETLFGSLQSKGPMVYVFYII